MSFLKAIVDFFKGLVLKTEKKTLKIEQAKVMRHARKKIEKPKKKAEFEVNEKKSIESELLQVKQSIAKLDEMTDELYKLRQSNAEIMNLKRTDDGKKYNSGFSLYEDHKNTDNSVLIIKAALSNQKIKNMKRDSFDEIAEHMMRLREDLEGEKENLKYKL